MTAASFDWGPLLRGGPFFIGILNITPDSFSDGGRFLGPDAALAQALGLVQAGARMLDLGAESTRPGAASVDAAEEWARLEAVLPLLAKSLPTIPLSLDTRHAEVASRGLAWGASVLNDVTGFSDPDMLALAQASPCGLIAMRSRRQGDGFLTPPYEDSAPKEAVAAIAELRALRDHLLEAGINPERVLLDPGFGFGTTYFEDQALWESLPRLADSLAWPADRFCIGISRKRFLAARAGTPELPPARRDVLTSAAHSEAIHLGYRVFRTHAIG